MVATLMKAQPTLLWALESMTKTSSTSPNSSKHSLNTFCVASLGNRPTKSLTPPFSRSIKGRLSGPSRPPLGDLAPPRRRLGDLTPRRLRRGLPRGRLCLGGAAGAPCRNLHLSPRLHSPRRKSLQAS